MEPLGASSINLHVTDLHETDQDDESTSKFMQMQSLTSLSRYEGTNFKSWLPQLISATIAAAFQIGNGIALAYSSVIISQLGEPDSEIKSDDRSNAWIASIMPLIQPLASIVCGILMDSCGRLNTIKIATIPGVVGWCTIALAQNVTMIIVGRCLIGASISCGTNPGMVYITEIASAKVRMTLLGMSSTFASLGMVLGYFGGWILDWRSLAYVSCLFLIVPAIGCFFIHESPAWLVWKGKTKRAEKSLKWLDKYQPTPFDKNSSLAALKLRMLMIEQEKKNERAKSMGVMEIVRELMKPTGYKPTIILMGLALFQHCSGVYTTLFYSISFIQEAGTDINGYLASILIGFIRLLMSVINMYLFKVFRRRTLYFISGFGMTICMFIAGLYTKWINEGETNANWVPVVAILMYVVFATIGFLFLPIMGIAELYPLNIRSVGFSISICLNLIVMFVTLQTYYITRDFFGGVTHLQWYYAIVSLAGLVYVYIFLPETQGMTLKEISENFNKGWTYIGHDHADKKGATNNNNK